jgi:hypothetical protein
MGLQLEDKNIAILVADGFEHVKLTERNGRLSRLVPRYKPSTAIDFRSLLHARSLVKLDELTIRRASTIPTGRKLRVAVDGWSVLLGTLFASQTQEI